MLVENPDGAGLVVVGRYSFPHEAHIARGLLESEGIPSFVADEYTINMQWLYSNALGGVRVMVPADYGVMAQEILEQDRSKPVEDLFESVTDYCPECGSTNIESHTKGKRTAFVVFILLGFPLFFYKHGLKCKQCDYFWQP